MQSAEFRFDSSGGQSMTGLEKMVSQILEEADASVAVTISDAEKKAAEILREARCV